MDKNNFLSGVYDEFARNITWSKWSDLQSSTMVVAISILILAVVLYIVDEVFIWFIQRIFSLHL